MAKRPNLMNETIVRASLADVQSGGRVRLGDALPPLPKAGYVTGGDFGHEAHNAFTPEQMRDYALAALSAQPSPGGQDGPAYEGHTWVSDYVLAGLRERAAMPLQLRNGEVWHWQGDGHDFPESLVCPVIMSAETLRALLAARRPVGEPVAIPEGWALVDLAEYTVLPQIPTTAMMDAGWPIGEQITDRFDVKGAYADIIAEHDAKGQGIIHGPSQQPAQAVDLPYSLDADPAGIRARVCDVITGTLMVGAQGHTPPPAGHWAEPFWQAARADAKAHAVDLGQTFQAGVAEWMGQCFLPSLYSNMTERGDRLLEEVLELLQAHGYDKARVPTLVDYVFGRPVGDPAQEVGGVMVTLAGYCWVAGLDMHAAGDAELARINQPDVRAKIRAKQEAKNALHFDSPLPGNAGAAVEEWPREGDLVRYGTGASALAIRLGPHAEGWHGYQCCGGYVFFTKAYRPTRADMDTWLDCAKYRDERTKVADNRIAHEMYLLDSEEAGNG
ncbi:TPA: hypothetical protein UM510_000395 [Stenotrophomonas maltophilia]|nr:hypothetical protein [Stenotrophomonas maltophilia]